MSSQTVTTPNQTITFADRAAIVTEYGVPVIPLLPGQKKAVLDDWQHLATTDPATIAEWDKQNSNYNCGAVGRPREFWMFDMDNAIVAGRIEKETGHSLDEIDTLVVKSSGDKRHYYLKHDARSEAMGNFSITDESGELFSVRAHNKYVVSAGSIHPATGLPYEIVTKPVWGEIPVAPDWLIDWLLLQQSKKNGTGKTAQQIPETINGGSRNDTLASVAGSLRHRGANEAAILAALRAVNQEQCVPPLDEAEVAKIAESYAKYSAGKKTSSTGSGKDFTESGNSPPTGAVRWEYANIQSTSKELVFHLPAVTTGTKHDYVITPTPPHKDGWFPLGSVSLIGAPSGGSKTTLMYQLMLTQFYKNVFFGHDTYGRTFLVLGIDRGVDAHERTMERMRLSVDAIPFKPLSPAFDLAAAQEIVERIEETNPLPEIVFVEGVDMLVTNVKDIRVVTSFMHELQKIAQHYHVALIGSLGSPKLKQGQGYLAKRDNLLGSVGWGRTAETIVNLQFPKSDDASDRRELYVLLRNAPAERFTLGDLTGVY